MFKDKVLIFNTFFQVVFIFFGERQLKGTSAHPSALKFQLNEARFQAYAPTNGKGKKWLLA